MKKASVLLIALCLMISMVFTGCGKKDTETVYDDGKDTVEQNVKDGVEDVKDGAENIGNDIKDGAEDIKDGADNMMDKANPDYNGADGPAADKDLN